jgi:hypothetical protein
MIYVRVFVQAILLISVLLACMQAPVNMLVDFLFQDIIEAPTADEFKVHMQTQQVRRMMGDQITSVAANARGAVRKSISLARNAFSVVPESVSKKRKKLAERVTSSVMEHFTVADATTRHVPPSVLFTYASTAMALSDVFGNADAVLSETGSPVRCYDNVEKGEIDEQDFNSIDSFESTWLEQFHFLQGSAKNEFQERWGLDPVALEAKRKNLVPSGVARTMRAWLGGVFLNPITRQDVLTAALEDSVKLSKDKIRKLKIATDIQVGLEVMHLFIIDLLG